MNAFIIFTVIILTLSLLFVSKKTNLLVDFKNQKHKNFVSKKNNHVLGGLIFIIFWIITLFFESSVFVNDMEIYYVCIFVFIIGLFSDFKILENPSKRFILQAVVLVCFIQYFNFSIPLSKIYIIDLFLNNNYFNKFFTIFCLMILINGYNFVDGINTLLINYNIVICLILFLFFKENIQDYEILKNFLIILFILLIFNLNGNLILGDSGSYAIGLFIGIYLINFAAYNQYLSPFWIISLVWYPCFELLFSMLRRFKLKRKMYKPDTSHYHQILFQYFNKKEKNNFISHLYVSLIINFYCFFSLILNKIVGLRSSEILIFILLNIFIYLFTYRKLAKNT